MITAAAAAVAVVLPGVAQAEPPSNDDFDASTVVSALPFTAQLDTSGATRANDDPLWCQSFGVGGTVWFSFTPAEDIMLRASTAGSDHPTILAANTGERGELRQVPGSCDTGDSSGATVTFRASAGTTYHFMVAGENVAGGALSFGLDVVTPAPNDNIADAEAIATLPTTRQPDLSTAWSEPDEPSSSCAGGTPGRSVWYAFTPAETASVVARVDNSQYAVTVYTGSAPIDLEEIECARGFFFESALFRATEGVTYYLGVSASLTSAGPVTFSLAEAPALRPIIGIPSDPNIYEETQLSVDAGDPHDQPIVGGEWNFGDGTTAPITEGERSTPHHYTADGTYQVSVTVVTQDGRTGTASRPVTVNTHDVSISRFSVPAKARTGQTKPITVHVANTRYPESATVILHRNDGPGWRQVGTLTLDVPARPDRTVAFPFAYTFTAGDAVAGKVTFRAEVRVPSPVRDARPQDNEVIAIATTVLPSLTDLRFA